MSFAEWSAVLGSWGEFIGSIAVVLTLIYLAIQVRQNSRQIQDNISSLQINAYQDLISRIAETNRLSVESAEWMDTMNRASETPEALNGNEFSRYLTHVTTLTRHADMAFMQYEKGMLDHERYISSLGPFIGLMRSSALARAHIRMLAENETSPFTASFKVELVRLLDEMKQIGRFFATAGEYHQTLLKTVEKESGR